MHITACNYSDDGCPASWGIWFVESETLADWLFDSDDLTKEQATCVVELLSLYWPTVDAVLAAFNDGTIDRTDKVVAAVKAGVTYVIHAIHDGTDMGIFRANISDMINGWAMSEDDAIATANTSTGNVFDFGSDFYQDAADDQVEA